MDQRIDPRDLTIGELVRMYNAHCELYYRDQDGKPTREHLNHSAALDWLIPIVDHDLPVAHLTKRDIRNVREQIVAVRRSRTYINAVMRRIRAMFKWAAEQDIIEDTPDDALASRLLGIFASLPPLKAHRTAAREYSPVEPVEPAHVIETLKHMNSVARDVMEVMLRTGARAQEIASLRVCEVVQEEGSWVAKPRKHKNAWRKHKRVIPLDAACMKIIHRHTSLSLFKDARCETPVFPSSRTGRPLTTNGMRSALVRAIAIANAKGKKVPEWHMHQMRHTAAKMARALCGLDEAQALMGHKSRGMTELYTGSENPEGARIAQRRVSRLVKGVR